MRSRHQSRRPRRVALTATVAAALVGALLAPAAEASTTATSPQGHALAVTPPMGFNNWARFGCGPDAPNPGDTGPTESLILGQARALVDNGLAAKGYRTVTVDDCWMTHARDAQGALVTDTGKFPGAWPTWAADCTTWG